MLFGKKIRYEFVTICMYIFDWLFKNLKEIIKLLVCKKTQTFVLFFFVTSEYSLSYVISCNDFFVTNRISQFLKDRDIS